MIAYRIVSVEDFLFGGNGARSSTWNKTVRIAYGINFQIWQILQPIEIERFLANLHVM